MPSLNLWDGQITPKCLKKILSNPNQELKTTKKCFIPTVELSNTTNSTSNEHKHKKHKEQWDDTFYANLLYESVFSCNNVHKFEDEVLWIWMIEITHLMMDDLILCDLLIYHTSDVILGPICSLVEVYRSSRICIIISTYEMHVELMVYCYLIMIPQWSRHFVYIAFYACAPIRWWTRFFIWKRLIFLEKRLGVVTYFCFIFKVKTK